MARVILIHGWNVTDRGKDTMRRLVPYLEQDHEVIVLGHDWPWSMIMGLMLQRRRSDKVSDKLGEIAKEGDVFVGHSNGAWISLLATRKGARPSHFVFLNPALRSEAPIPDKVDSVDVFHAPNDMAVRVGAFLRKCKAIHAVLPLPWGNMGRYGYTGDDPRIRSHNMGDLGHSGVFEELDKWGPTINQVIKSREIAPLSE